MRCLARRFRVIPLEELVLEVANGTKVSVDTVAVTFDDGYLDNFTNAFPILKKYNLPATIFLIADFIGTSNCIWWDYLSDLLKNLLEQKPGEVKFNEETIPLELRQKLRAFVLALKESEKWQLLKEVINTLKGMCRKNREVAISYLAQHVRVPRSNSDNRHAFLSWEQVQEMQGHGISFGAHSCTHPHLSTLDVDSMKWEIDKSKAILEEKLQAPVRLFAYPSGNFNQTTKQLVKEAGFVAALANNQGRVESRTDLFEMRRFGVCDETFRGVNGKFSRSLFYLKMSGLFDRFFL
ncbi:MAG: polysaccharide deacetylase family protein [bacterium]